MRHQRHDSAPWYGGTGSGGKKYLVFPDLLFKFLCPFVTPKCDMIIKLILILQSEISRDKYVQKRANTFLQHCRNKVNYELFDF